MELLGRVVQLQTHGRQELQQMTQQQHGMWPLQHHERSGRGLLRPKTVRQV